MSNEVGIYKDKPMFREKDSLIDERKHRVGGVWRVFIYVRSIVGKPLLSNKRKVG